MSPLLSDRFQLQIIVNGDTVEGLLQASIVTTNCFSSDSFSLTFAMGPLPLGDMTFWSTLSSAYVEVSAVTALGVSPSPNLISGMVDIVNINPIAGIVAIEGRDLSSSLIDSYRQEDFVNQTASEVVSTIALNHGLMPMVVPTSTNVGRYYGAGYTRLSLGQFSRLRSDWDLVVQLARENGFDVFVQDTALFFQPSNALDIQPIHIALRDIKSIRFEHALTVASKSTARVQSWNSQHMRSYTSNATGEDAPEGERDIGSAGQFLFSASNFTSQEVTDAAARFAAELSRLNIVLNIDMPWDLSLSPRMIVLIDETNTSFDRAYRIDNIDRHYSSTSGSSQNIRAVAI